MKTIRTRFLGIFVTLCSISFVSNCSSDPAAPVPVSPGATCPDTFSGTLQFGVASESVFTYANTVDSNCNFFIAGFTTVGLDGNSLSGSTDLFVMKFDHTGNKVWTKMLGSTIGHVVYVYAMASDSEGSVYLTGITDGNVSDQTLTGTQDVILVKYDKDGALLWTRQVGASGQDTFGYAVAVDTDNHVFVTGQTWGNLDSNTLIGSDDAFLMKFDKDGTRLWTQTLGAATASTYPAGVAVSASGTVYIAGYTYGNLPGNTLTGTGDAFLAKYDGDGNRIWVTQYGQSSKVTSGKSLGIDPSENLFVAGVTTGDLDGSLAGTQDLFIAKYDSSGSRLWTRQLGVSAAGVLVDYDTCSSDAEGNVYVGGQVNGGLDGNASVGNLDVFVTKYDGSGSRQWTRQYGAPSQLARVLSLSINPAGTVFLAGLTDGNFNGETLTGNSDGIAFALDADGHLK